eukprot:1080420-Rhodomonas_salina.5
MPARNVLTSEIPTRVCFARSLASQDASVAEKEAGAQISAELAVPLQKPDTPTRTTDPPDSRLSDGSAVLMRGCVRSTNWKLVAEDCAASPDPAVTEIDTNPSEICVLRGVNATISVDQSRTSLVPVSVHVTSWAAYAPKRTAMLVCGPRCRTVKRTSVLREVAAHVWPGRSGTCSELSTKRGAGGTTNVVTSVRTIVARPAALSGDPAGVRPEISTLWTVGGWATTAVASRPLSATVSDKMLTRPMSWTTSWKAWSLVVEGGSGQYWAVWVSPGVRIASA